MMLGGGAMSLQGSMCTTKTNKRDTIELPADAGAGAGRSAGVHCEQCVAPLLGAPLADLRTSPSVRATPSVSAPLAAQVSDTRLVRAQSARAPPLV
jgi:hypothetical protein